MHNGCLLLLAFIAVFQPIASYSELGLVDGRQQRCEYRTSVRDPGLNFHGTSRFNKPAVEDRRLSHREDTREDRRNEVRAENHRIASSSDKRLADAVERDWNTLTRLSKNRIGNDADLWREKREARARLISSHRDERSQKIQRERLLRVQETHEARFASRRENSRLSEDENRSQSIDNRRISERVSVESRRDTRAHGGNSDIRVSENREVRVESFRPGSLNTRRLAGNAVQRMDTRRSVSRIEEERDANRETLLDAPRRSTRNLRRSLTSEDIINRARHNRESRLTPLDTTSMDRNERRSQRAVDVQSQRDSRIRLSVERRNIRDSASRKVPEDQRARSAHSRREIRDNENKLVRSVDDHISRNVRSGSRLIQREIAAENRKDVREARSMARIGLLERTTDRSSRSLERNMEREFQQNMNTNRAAESRHTNRDTCVYDRENRIARIVIREPSRENRRNIDSAAFRGERTDEGRRVARVIRTERIDENRREARNVGIRAFRIDESERAVSNERDESRRNARSVAVRSFRIERSEESRRDARNIAVRGFRTERSDESRRDVRTAEVRAFGTERTDESHRDSRNIAVRLFRTERSDESRRNVRNVKSRLSSDENSVRNVELRAFRTERTDENRREVRSVGARTFRAERTDESRRDARDLGIRAFRSEHSDESQRDARNVDTRAFQIERSAETRRVARNEVRATDSATYRRESRGSERQSRSLDSRNNIRDSRVQERKDESRRTLRYVESRIEDARVDRRTGRSIEREIRVIGRERSMENRLNAKTNRDSSMFTLERRSTDRREPATGNHRDARNVHRELRTLDDQEREVQSRRMNLRSINDFTQRQTDRVADRLNKRDSLDSRRTYTLKRDSRRYIQKSSERDNLVRGQEAESRNAFDTITRNREFQSMFKIPSKTKNETPIMNWQCIFYILQGLYICGLLMQLNKGRAEKKTKISWWPAPQHLIKVE